MAVTAASKQSIAHAGQKHIQVNTSHHNIPHFLHISHQSFCISSHIIFKISVLREIKSRRSQTPSYVIQHVSSRHVDMPVRCRQHGPQLPDKTLQFSRHTEHYYGLRCKEPLTRTHNSYSSLFTSCRARTFPAL